MDTKAEETTPTAAESTDAESPPQTVSLDVIAAMHRRLLKLQGEQQAHAGLLDGIKTAVDRLGAMVLDLTNRLEETVASVVQHADLLDGVRLTLGEIAGRANPRPRGEGPRLLPGSTEPPPVTETNLSIDPKKVGTTIAKLPDGQEVEINVRRPGQMIRDGRPVGPNHGKVRRS